MAIDSTTSCVSETRSRLDELSLSCLITRVHSCRACSVSSKIRPWPCALTLPVLVPLQTTKGAADGQSLWQSDSGLCMAAQLDTCNQFSSCINTTFSITVAEGAPGVSPSCHDVPCSLGFS